MMNRLKYNYLKINSEYYAFLSGALISIPLTLLLEIKDNLSNIFFWIGLVLSAIASFLCFILSIKLKAIHEKYEQAKKAYLKSEGGEKAAWNEVVTKDATKKMCVPLFYSIVITFVISLACIVAMQFVVADGVKDGQSLDGNDVASMTESEQNENQIMQDYIMNNN